MSVGMLGQMIELKMLLLKLTCMTNQPPNMKSVSSLETNDEHKILGIYEPPSLKEKWQVLGDQRRKLKELGVLKYNHHTC